MKLEEKKKSNLTEETFSFGKHKHTHKHTHAHTQLEALAQAAL